MSSTGHLPELESLRSQVADLARELAERDQARQAQQQGIDNEVQDLRKQSDLLRAIMEGTAADMGDDFFASLATHLTSTLHMQYALIGEVLERTPATLRTLAVSSGGTLLENFEYDLATAPCRTGLTEPFWCFEQGVQALFPNFPPLATMGVESHSGVSIRNHHGNVVGLIVMMDTKPIASQERLQALLQIFAPRAAAELHRRQAEQEYRQAIHELQNIMETVPDFMFTLDTQGNMVKWNRHVEEVTGYTPEELHNKSALAFVPAQEQEHTALAIRRAFTDGYAELEGHLLTKDQRTIPYHWTGAALKDPQGRIIGITGIGRDVSEQKQAAESLRRQRHHLLEAQALAHLGSWEWDINSGDTVWSEEQFRIFGHEPGAIAVTYDTFLAALLPDDHDRVLAAVNDALLGKCPLDLECRIVRPNGDIRVIHMRADVQHDAIGLPIGMAGTALDITERKQAEEALRASEERWHLAVQGSNDGIWDWNIQSGEIFFSARWKAMRGFADHEVTNHIDEWRSRIHPDDLDHVLQSIDHYLAKQTSAFCEEYRVQRKDGSYMWILDRGVALWAEDGTPVRMAGSESDITDRKLAEELLHKSVTRFDLAVQGSQDGLWYAERVSDNLFAPHNPIYYSPRMKEIMGVEHGAAPDVLGTWLSLVHPDDLPTVLAALTQHLEQRLPYDVEYRILQHGTGTLRWIGAKGQAVWDSSGIPIRMAGSFSDITERKRAEHKHSLTQYTVDHAIDAFYWIDPQAKILDVNEAASLMLGYTQDELLAMSVHDLNPAFQADSWPGFWAESKLQRSMQFETTHRTKQGQLIPVEIQVNYLTFEGKEFHCAYVRDITERKRAELALRESEGRTRSILETALDAVVSINESGLIIGWNPQAEILFGYSAHDVLGRPLDETIIPARYRQAHAHGMNRIVRGGEGSATKRRFEFFALHRSGQEFPVEFAIAASHVDGQPMFTAFIRDITERKQAEEALRESEERYRTLVELSPSGVFVFSEGQTVYVNSMAMTILGATEPNDILTRAPFEFIHPDYHEDVTKNLRRVLAGETTVHRAERVYLKMDGTSIHVQVEAVRITWNGKPAIQGFFSDITERKRMEEVLRASEERFRSLFENSPTAYQSLDLGGRLIDVNQKLCHLLGYERQELLGKSFDEFWADQITCDFPKVFDAFTRSGEVRNELSLRRKDGTIVEVLIEGRIQRDRNGEFVRAHCILTDITERKRAEEATTRSYDLMKSFVEHTPAAVAMLDKDLRYVAVSRRWLQDYRLGNQDLVGKRHYDVFPEICAMKEWRAIHQRCLAGAVERREEDRFVRADGSEDWLRWEVRPWQDVMGHIGGIIMFTEVITERKKAEEALCASEERFRAVVENAAIGIVVGSHLTGNGIDQANPAICAMTGYSAEELRSLGMQGLTHPDELPASKALIARLYAGQASHETMVKRYRKKDGTYLWAQTTVSVIRDAQGQYSSSVAMIQDITDRKQMEDRLRTTQYAVDHAADSMFFIGHDGYFVDVNESACRRLGYTKQELLTMSVMDIDPDFLPAVWDGFWAEFKRTKLVHLETRHRSKSGEIYPVEVTANYLLHNGQEIDCAIVRDITERKQAEEALRRSEQQLRTVLDTLPIGVWFTDEKGHVLYGNPVGHRIWAEAARVGLPQPGGDGLWWETIAQPESPHRWAVGTVLARGQDVQNETLAIETRTGECRIIRNSAVPVKSDAGEMLGAIVLNEDITDRVRAEKALLQEHALLMAVMDAATDIIFVKDLEGQYIHINRAGAHTVGIPVEEVIGWNDYALWPSGLAASCQLADRRVLETGEPVTVEETSVCDGVTTIYLTTKAPYRNSEGQIIGVIGVARDITERKQAEQALRDSEERYRSLVDGAPIGIYVNENGLFSYLNKEMVRILKADCAEDLVGTSVMERIAPEYHQVVRERIQTLVIDHKPVPPLDELYLCLDGSQIDVAVTAIPAPFGGATAMQVLVLDITERKRAEEALRASEERFAKAFRSSPYPIVISELESGLFIDANDAAYQAFGYQREDVANRTSTELHLWPTPDHRMQFVGQLRQAGAIRNLEIDLRMRNGELRHCLVSAELIELYGKRCMVTVGTDITEQKRAEEALREQHALLSAIMNTTMDIIFVKDLQGRYLHINPAGARVVGLPPQEIVGKDDDAIWPADLAACCMEADRQILATGCTQTMEESTLANGKRITYLTTKAPYRDAAGNMIGIIGVAHDISQIKQSEEDLRRSHAFIRQIIDTDPNFIFAKDREGRFTLVNKAVADAYGTTVDHLTGKTDADFNSNTRELAHFRKIDLEVLDSLREQFVPEEMITDAAGRTRWLQTVKRPILDESGLATMVLGACTDITERKRMEETLRQRERDLRTALDERERISQDLHDGILQSLYAVGLGLEACKPLMTQRHYKKAAASMDRAIGHLNHVMSEVRNFIAGLESQILQGSTFPMALRTMVLTLTADHPIPCSLTIDESLATTFSTEQALHLLNVVREALSNSLRHAEATKTTISLKSLSRSIRLTIADNGRGFDPASMHGAGHGLTNMEARVRKIGGRFAIRSVPQHGTRITIDLPKETSYAESESEYGSTAARR